MEVLHITEVPSTSEMFFAGVWDRVMAKLIDYFLLALCLLPFDLGFGTSLVVERGDHSRSAVEACAVFLVFCLYSAVLESSKRQATVGKSVVGILVSDLDGNRISFGRALLRAALQFTIIGCLLAAFTRRKQGLHDLIAEAQVVPGTL